MSGCANDPLSVQSNTTKEEFSHSVNSVKVRREYADTRYGQVHLRLVEPLLEKKNQRPIMMLHLSPNSGQVFSEVLPLIGKDRLALAPDYPGYGMSDPIPGTQKIEDYAKAMLDVLQFYAPHDTADLLGYHTGSAVALEMARQQPSRINKIILMAVPVLTEEERETGAAIPYIAYDEDGVFAQQEWQRSWKWRGPGQSAESVMATFGEKMRPGVRERGAKAILAYDLAPILETAVHPLMIVRVKDDLWEPSSRAYKIRPDAKYLEYPDFGHGIFHVIPDRLNLQMRSFLDH